MNLIMVLCMVSLVYGLKGTAILREIQKYREEKGLRPLVYSMELEDAARESAEMLLKSNGILKQNIDLWSLAKKYKFNPGSIGENIGKSHNPERNGLDIFEEWIKSDTHKENITDANEYTHIGIYKLIGESKTFYVSAMFGRTATENIPKSKEDPIENSNLSVTSTRQSKEVSNPQSNPSPDSHSVTSVSGSPLTYLLTLPPATNTNTPTAIKLILLKETEIKK
ncbi:hypothetical protein NEOKW01_1491 [Nematocida sp. AWRm80]|nr:hypothetical protein NEOKW01_1491 [Nematocida sp. AWRm80]